MMSDERQPPQWMSSRDGMYSTLLSNVNPLVSIPVNRCNNGRITRSLLPTWEQHEDNRHVESWSISGQRLKGGEDLTLKNVVMHMSKWLGSRHSMCSGWSFSGWCYLENCFMMLSLYLHEITYDFQLIVLVQTNKDWPSKPLPKASFLCLHS